MREPLYPYQYHLIWLLIREPLTPGELAASLPNRWWEPSPVGVANSLRPLLKRGWVARDEHGIYRATDRAREAVSW